MDTAQGADLPAYPPLTNMNHEGAQNYFRWGKGCWGGPGISQGMLPTQCILLQLQHFQLTSILGSKVEVLKESESLR